MAEVRLYQWDTGEWSALVVDGKLIYEGNSIPDFIWLDTIKKLGNTIYDREVPFTDDEGPFRFEDLD